MDRERFDQATRLLAGAATRRQGLIAAFGAILAAPLALDGIAGRAGGEPGHGESSGDAGGGGAVSGSAGALSGAGKRSNQPHPNPASNVTAEKHGRGTAEPGAEAACARLANGRRCGKSAKCCSKYCAKGSCRCKPNHMACSADSQCCSSSCADGRCDGGCAESGAPCRGDANCCDGMVCRKGRCKVSDAASCTAASCPGCCDGTTCRVGTTNAACGRKGAACARCKGGQTCDSGRRCAASPRPTATPAPQPTAVPTPTPCPATWEPDGPDESAAEPVGVAMHETATDVTTWIAEPGNDRIKLLYRSEESSSIGSPGSNPGELTGPTGVAVTPDALTVAVADTGNNRVEFWSRANATFSTPWTFVNAVTGPSNELAPRGVTFSADGKSCWASFSGSGVVVEYQLDSGSGSWLYNALFGSGLDGPAGLAVSADSLTLLIADTGNNRVAVWTRANIASAWSEQTTFGGGQFSQPAAVALSADAKTAFVADSGNNRVAIWSRSSSSATDWAQTATFGEAGSGSGQFSDPGAISLSGDALTATIADTGNDRLSIWTRPDAASTTWTNPDTEGLDFGPAGLAVATTATSTTSWITDSGGGRVVLLYRSRETSYLGSTGSNPGELSGPTGVAITPDALTVAVADTGNNRVCLWSRVNTSFSTPWTFVNFVTGPNNELAPAGIAFSADGKSFWTTFSGSNRIAEYQWNSGAAVWVFQAIFGAGPGKPTGIAASADGRTLVVADSGSNRAVAWARADAASPWFPQVIFAGGTLKRPWGVALTADAKTAFIVDSGHDRVAVWSRSTDSAIDWLPMLDFGETGSEPGQFSDPAGIALSDDGLSAVIAETGANLISAWSGTLC